jgi:hypothetical protein
MPINPRITIHRTPGEWEEIDLQIKARGKKTVSGYLGSEVSKLTKAFIKNPSSITSGSGGEKKANQFRIEYQTYLILKEVAIKMNRSVDSIVDDLVIVPLLAPKP